jgi:hypothetical protein
MKENNADVKKVLLTYGCYGISIAIPSLLLRMVAAI